MGQSRPTLRHLRSRLQNALSTATESRRPPRTEAAAATCLALLGCLDLVPMRDRRTVVVLADAVSVQAIAEALTGWSDTDTMILVAPEEPASWDFIDREVAFHPARTLAQISSVLRTLGPVDVMFDLQRQPAQEHDVRWRRLFFHLRARGIWVLPRTSIVDSSAPAMMVATGAWIGLPASEQRERPAGERELALATTQLRVDSAAFVVVKQRRHLLKVRDGDANRILSLREPKLELEILHREPGGVVRSRAEISSHGTYEAADLGTELDYPELFLRRYTGKIAMVAASLLYTGSSALPDSFRHHRTPGMRNPQLVDANGDFARLPARARPVRRLDGIYYQLDAENSGHFGHVMTEVVSRLWGWDIAKAANPELKAIFRIRYPHERQPSLEQAIFTAYGIAADDIVWIDEPVWLESTVAATPMWHNARPHYVHPGITAVWDRMRVALVTENGGLGLRIFVSRRSHGGNRVCRNAAEVESFFAAHGFTIVYPEDHSLAEQASIFAAARVIAGFGGSAMFSLLYATGAPTVIILNHSAYTARNEHLYTVLTGGAVHYFWSSPDVAHPDGGWSQQAYYSDWQFDFAQHRDVLSRLLTGLPVGG